MAITLLRGQHRECATGHHHSGDAAAATLDPDLLTRTSWTDAHTALLQIKKVCTTHQIIHISSPPGGRSM